MRTRPLMTIFLLFVVAMPAGARVSEIKSAKRAGVINANATSGESDASAPKAKLENLNCWKGFTKKEQETNLFLCRSSAKSNQVCEDNVWKHGQAVFDVCLRGFRNPPTRVVSCLKGFNQAEQDRNLRACRTQVSDSQVCETDVWTHKNAVYDVCIME